jgi:penicillin-binding protein 1A
MAWGRKKGGGRKEPLFGLPAALADLRLSPSDRIPGGGDDKPAKSKNKSADKSSDSGSERPRPSRSGSKRRSKSRGFGIGRLFYWTAVLGLWAGIAVIGVVVWVGAHLPPIQSLEIPKRPPTIQIVGMDGSVLAQRGEMAGANIALKDLPPYLPKAFIAIEDRRFYSHFGVDPVGILRAAITNVLHRGVSQGGSTLTQQLAKNLFLTQERTMQRKLQEAELALWLERKHTKDEILELYLNRVYFGSGAYGVEAAAQRYFGKSAKNVTLPEAAMLAGLVKSPSRLAPNRNPEGAEQRAQIVLAAMADAKFITDAQAKASIGQPSIAVKPAGAGTVNYVADWIGEVLDDLVGQIDQDIVVADHDRSEAAKRRRSRRDRRAGRQERQVQCQPGCAGGDDARWRSPRHGRRPELFREPIQPGGDREAPAGLGVQAIRLSHRGRVRADAGHHPHRRAARHQGLEAGELHPRIFRLGDADPGAGDVAQHRGGAARRRGRRRNVVRTAHRLGISSKLEPNVSIALGTSEVSAARTGRRLCAVRQWRLRGVAACGDQDQDQFRQAALRSSGRSAEPGDRTAL